MIYRNTVRYSAYGIELFHNVTEIPIDFPDDPRKEVVGPLNNQTQITAEPID